MRRLRQLFVATALCAFGTVALAEAPRSGGLPSTGAPIDRSEFLFARILPAGPIGLTAVSLDAAVLAHSASLADLRIADADGHQVPYVLEKLAEPLTVELDRAQRRTGESPPRESRYEWKLPYENLPPSRLVIATTSRVFERRVTLSFERPPADGRSLARREVVASTEWRHAEPDTAASELVLDLPSLPAAAIEFAVDDGDNAPLPISRVRLQLPAYRLRFVRATGAALTLLYGQPKLSAPRYDLALLAPELIGARANEIALAPEPAPSAIAVERTAHGSRIFWMALVAAIAVLLVVIGRLLSKRDETEPAA